MSGRGPSAAQFDFARSSRGTGWRSGRPGSPLARGRRLSVASAAIGRLGWAFFILLVLAAVAVAAEPRFPALTGRVVDQANVLSAATRERLTEMLVAHEQASRQQVVVVTVPSLQGLAIEDFGYRL